MSHDGTKVSKAYYMYNSIRGEYQVYRATNQFYFTSNARIKHFITAVMWSMWLLYSASLASLVQFSILAAVLEKIKILTHKTRWKKLIIFHEFSPLTCYYRELTLKLWILKFIVENLGQMIGPSQDLHLHRTIQYRKTRKCIHTSGGYELKILAFELSNAVHTCERSSEWNRCLLSCLLHFHVIN
jgi:hypothetical protein